VRTMTDISTVVEATVRLAASEDRAALRAMYESFEPRPASLGLPPRVKIDEWLDRLASAVNYLALVDGKLVGHAVLCPENETGEVAVFVHQDHRGQGIGRQLLTALVQEGRRLGLRRLWGMTELDNVPMLALAHTVGFVADADPEMFHMDLTTEPAARRS
jgi:L-amino acid N-acyltransferase YncA